VCVCVCALAAAHTTAHGSEVSRSQPLPLNCICVYTCVCVCCTVQDGRTPLHFVSGEGYTETAALLIEKGADVMIQSNVCVCVRVCAVVVADCCSVISIVM
jgi:hypothetical protein